MDNLREALARSLFDVVSGREMVADMLMRELRAYAARGEVVERCARVREAHYEKHGFGETPIDGFEIAAMQAALAAFLGEET